MPNQGFAARILAQWRDAERALAGVKAGSPEAGSLTAEATRLRDEYQRFVSEATHDDQSMRRPASRN